MFRTLRPFHFPLSLFFSLFAVRKQKPRARAQIKGPKVCGYSLSPSPFSFFLRSTALFRAFLNSPWKNSGAFPVFVCACVCMSIGSHRVVVFGESVKEGWRT